MSYYFAIVNTRDQPLFEIDFGTSKQGGDGVSRFSQEARQLNPYLIHAAIDFVDEYQFTNNAMYLKRIDSFASTQISCFLTPTSTRFLLLHLPHPPNQTPQQPPSSSLAYPPFTPYTSQPSTNTTSSTSGSSNPGKNTGGAGGSTSIPNNAASPQTEEAIRQFFGEVFEIWIKAVMNPFQSVEGRIGSGVFRERVKGAGKKYL